MNRLQKTVFYSRHITLGAKIVEFGGWHMPLMYRQGIVNEHLTTRKRAGLFDVSHMGRFVIRGKDALAFLQHVLSGNAAALEVGESQYTIIPNNQGGAIDDAYLYRFVEDEYLLVVNASNQEIDWKYLQPAMRKFSQVEMVDRTHELAMISLQGPLSKEILSGIVNSGHLPEPVKNTLSIATINNTKVFIARTGYTGEPLGFELFINCDDAVTLWDQLIDRGAKPAGLGARDTLRLEAGLPLYGHELGVDPDGREIPIFSYGLSRHAVSFTPLKGEFVGREALERQSKALERIINRDYSLTHDLPRIIRSVALVDRGQARAGYRVFRKDRHVGYVTSGTMVPYWKNQGTGISSRLAEEKGMRAICLALLDSDLCEGDEIHIEIRGRKTGAVIVPYHLRSEAPPYARSILYNELHQGKKLLVPIQKQ